VAASLRATDGWPDHDPSLTGGVADLDDFSACKIARKEDWVDLYAKPFYFGLRGRRSHERLPRSASTTRSARSCKRCTVRTSGTST